MVKKDPKEPTPQIGIERTPQIETTPYKNPKPMTEPVLEQKLEKKQDEFDEKVEVKSVSIKK